MKLVNMKMTVEEQYPKTAEPSSPGPTYPWGLTLRLEEAVLARLGIKELPEAEAELMLTAKVMVTEVMSRDEVIGGETRKCRSLSLQITDLGLGAVKEETKDAAKSLYKE